MTKGYRKYQGKYAPEEKCEIIARVNEAVKKGYTQKRACEDLMISVGTYYTWKHDPGLEAMLKKHKAGTVELKIDRETNAIAEAGVAAKVPSPTSTKKRRYTDSEKQGLLENVNLLRDKGFALKDALKIVGITNNSYHQWTVQGYGRGSDNKDGLEMLATLKERIVELENDLKVRNEIIETLLKGDK